MKQAELDKILGNTNKGKTVNLQWKNLGGLDFRGKTLKNAKFEGTGILCLLHSGIKGFYHESDLYLKGTHPSDDGTHLKVGNMGASLTLWKEILKLEPQKLSKKEIKFLNHVFSVV